MLEEENSLNNPINVVAEADLEQPYSNVGVALSSPAAVKVYATTAEAIANFKPTPRDVISGIAPHVFDERKRRRSRRRASSPSHTYWCNQPSREKRSSPLGGTIVCAWEAERSIYPGEQTASKHSHLLLWLEANTDPPHRLKENNETNSIRAFTTPGTPNVQLQKTAHNNTATGTLEKINSDKLKTEQLWKYLRFDTKLLKFR